MNAQHTPGSWKAFGRGVFAGEVQVGDAAHPRDVEDQPDGKFPTDYDECIANARLIAAVPDMLAALQAVLLFHSGSPWTPEKAEEWYRLCGEREETTRNLGEVVRAAIAKATTP